MIEQITDERLGELTHQRYTVSGAYVELLEALVAERAKVAELSAHVINDCEIMLGLLEDTASEDVKSMMRNLIEELIDE